jgi:hypothetical protein
MSSPFDSVSFLNGILQLFAQCAMHFGLYHASFNASGMVIRADKIIAHLAFTEKIVTCFLSLFFYTMSILSGSVHKRKGCSNLLAQFMQNVGVHTDEGPYPCGG